MDYQVYISTPKETPESAALKTELHLTKGRVLGGWIYFPYGPAGVLHFQLFRGDEQIAPSNRGASYNLDDAVIPLSLDFELEEPPYLLFAKTWNTSTSYAHALNLALFLREPEKTKPKGNSPLEKRAAELIAGVKRKNGGLS